MGKDPNKTLTTILGIINKDVGRLRKKSGKGKLSAADVLTLNRYASTVADIRDESEDEKQKLKRKYEKMSTEELLKLYMEEKQKKEQVEKK